MAEETTRKVTPSKKRRRHEDVTALSTQQLKHSEEVVHGEQPEDVTRLHTKELELPGKLEHGQETEDVAALSTQGLAHAGEPAKGRQPEDVTTQSTQGLAHEEEPAKGQELEDVTVLNTQGLAHVEEKEREKGDIPEQQARRGFARKWIVLAVICILLLIGGTGAFLFMQHSQSPVSSGTISPTSDTT